MGRIITEITPLSETDCFYFVSRTKKSFDYPIHRHDDIELNFVKHCKNARRVVGDSIEEVGDYDLVLVGGGLAHCWEQYECKSDEITEITIQFPLGLFSDDLLKKNQLKSIKEMLGKAKVGIAFGLSAIMEVYSKLTRLEESQPGFIQLLHFFEVLYELSVTSDYHLLSSSSFADARLSSDSRRIRKVEEFIHDNYQKQINFTKVADMVGMAPTAFSRFFKLRTGRTLSDYLIGIRLGHASRLLVDTTMTMAEICYQCGFNNISNFNRIFKKRKGCSPKEFRESYLRTKLIV
jgi:AraC-like DNA-binding protein